MNAEQKSDTLPPLEREKREKRKFRTLTLVFGIATLLALGAAIAQLYWNYRRGVVLDKSLFAQGDRLLQIQQRIFEQTTALQDLEERILAQ